MFSGVIYKHQNKLNGKCYIGQTKKRVEERFGPQGKGYSGSKFGRAIDKYGWKSFTHEVLETIETDTEEELQEKLNRRERFYISMFDSYKNGYNADLGGNAKIVSEETKEKLRLANIGKKVSEETKRKISERMKGVPKKNKEAYKISNGKRKGIPRSEETRRKISEIRTGQSIKRTKPVSTETRKKLSDCKKGKKPWNYGLRGKNKEMTDLQLEKLYNFCCKLRTATKQKEKAELLTTFATDEDVRYFLHFELDLLVCTGLKRTKLTKELPESTRLTNNNDITFIQLLQYLEKQKTGGAQANFAVRCFIDKHVQYKEFIIDCVARELRLGVQATTVNKYIPGCCKCFDVMLAEKYFDDPIKYLPEGTQFILTEKLDGVRCALLFDENKEPHFFSRNGKEIMDLVDLAKEAKQLDPNYVYDGELLANTVGHSKDVYRDTMSIVGSDNVKTGVLYNVFDKVLRKDFEAGYSNTFTINRKYDLEQELTTDKFTWIRKVPMLYIGDNQERILEYLNWAKGLGKEGVMINWATGPYECKRSRKLLKVKSFNETEAYVEELVEGTGRNAGRLGAIIIKFKDKDGKYHSCNCGSGFSDKERDLYWAQPELIKNKVVEVSYFEVSNNQTDDSLSLRFPTWLGRIRNDKTLEQMNHI